MAFEVDAIDESWQEGWSVVVHGHAMVLHEEAEIARFDEHLARSWVPVKRTHHIKIKTDAITGRSIDTSPGRRAEVPPWS